MALLCTLEILLAPILYQRKGQPRRFRRLRPLKCSTQSLIYPHNLLSHSSARDHPLSEKAKRARAKSRISSKFQMDYVEKLANRRWPSRSSIYNQIKANNHSHSKEYVLILQSEWEMNIRRRRDPAQRVIAKNLSTPWPNKLIEV